MAYGKVCKIDGCEKGGGLRRGWCAMHYRRWMKHGDPFGGNRYCGDPEGTFLARSEPLVGDPGCIVWTGALNSDGYGHLKVEGREVKAHRYAYERAHGPIPKGVLVDHACHDRSCVNADHLRLATHRQNAQNRTGAVPGRKHALPRGVTPTVRGLGYRARVGDKHVGVFSTPEEASAAAETQRRVLFGEFAGNA